MEIILFLFFCSQTYLLRSILLKRRHLMIYEDFSEKIKRFYPPIYFVFRVLLNLFYRGLFINSTHRIMLESNL